MYSIVNAFVAPKTNLTDGFFKAYNIDLIADKAPGSVYL